MGKKAESILLKIKGKYLLFKEAYSPVTPKYLRRSLLTKGDIGIDECKLLYELASQAFSGCIVEIGSYLGKSTIALAGGSKQHNKVPVYAIEPHEVFNGLFGGQYGPKDRKSFFKNIIRTNVCDLVHLVNLSSEEASKGWSKDIALLFIDGDHRHSSVKKDFECWAPFVTKNGIIIFHDSINPNSGPFKIITEAISAKKFKKIGQIGVSTILEKL